VLFLVGDVACIPLKVQQFSLNETAIFFIARSFGIVIISSNVCVVHSRLAFVSCFVVNKLTSRRSQNVQSGERRFLTCDARVKVLNQGKLLRFIFKLIKLAYSMFRSVRSDLIL
jgi:hypothetical protein